MEPFITKKAHTFLTEILLAEQLNFKQDFNTELHAIVFVERRCTAVILSNLINYQAKSDPENFGKLQSNYVLGHAFEANIHLADGLMRSSKQNEILADFKRGKYNVLVSTSVVEEGLDVRKCNLVVRFSGIGNYRQYAQSKGRARSKSSKFIVMTPDGGKAKMEVELKLMQEIEKILYEKCRRDRSHPTEEEIDDAMFDEDNEFVPTYYVDDGPNPARITHKTCVPLLHRFCQTLKVDKFSVSKPYFEEKKRGIALNEEVICKVLLPGKVPLEDKEFEGYWMPNDRLAKKSVCMVVCIALHTLGVLDHHLLTTVLEEEEEMEVDEEEDKEYAASNQAVYPRKIPTVLSPHIFETENCSLYAISMVLSEPRDNPGACALWQYWFNERTGFGIILPDEVPKVLPKMKLFTQAGGILVNLKFICSLDHIPEKTKQYHQFIIGACAEKFLSAPTEFDFDNPIVSKGLLVPLKNEVFENIDDGEKLQRLRERVIDFETFENFQTTDQSIRENSVIHKTYIDEKQNQRLYYVTGLSQYCAGDKMEASKTYTQHYFEKYQRKVDPTVRLLETISASSKVNLVEIVSNNEFNRKTRGVERLVPGLCEKMFDVDASTHQQMILLPYILYTYECILNADELRHDISNKIGISHDPVPSKSSDMDLGYHVSETSVLVDALRMSNEINRQTACPSVMDIVECITSRQARFPYDYERLEMLGDSFLKLAVTIYLYYMHPSLEEGKLALKRTKSIENKNLFHIAEKLGIQNIISNSQFGNVNENNMNKNSVTVWLPPGYKRKVNKDDENCLAVPYQDVRKKTLADCVEALIGVYFKTGGINLALKFMQEYLGLDVLFSTVVEHGKVITNDPSGYADYPRPDNAIANSSANYDDVDQLFKDWKFERLEGTIGYKFRDRSYLLQAMKHQSYYLNSVTNCYERLEFLGDAVIDFLITLHVYQNKTHLNPGELTSIRSALVNNNTFALLVIKNRFDTHIKHFSPDFDRSLKEFKTATRFGEDLESFNVCFKNPFVIIPKDSQEGYHAPKILGDIFEAIIGAVFLDCHLDLVKVWQVIYPLMEDIIVQYMDEIPLNPVRELVEKYSDAEWTYEEIDEDTHCTAHFNNGQTVVGIGRNKKMAKATASWKAVHPE